VNHPTLVSIQVGKPEERVETRLQDGKPETWTSGIFKVPVTGRVWVGKQNLEGDGQADLRYHGGVDRPILAYSADHYEKWKSELGDVFPYGSFGENLTVAGLTEDIVCIGDTYRIGDVVVQVSQPRIPCWKLGRRHGMPELPAKAMNTGRTGWYLRVLDEGWIEAGMRMELVNRPCPEWTIARAHSVWRNRTSEPDVATELGQCPYLSRDWRTVLAPPSAESAAQ
jgi:MOSC domain-containing protein YiiM